MTFAEVVVERMVKKYPSCVTKHVNIWAVDNSSTFLATFVKILMPHWVIGFTKKTMHEEMFQGQMPDPIASIFVDDYHSAGTALNAVLTRFQDQDKKSLIYIGESLEVFFIDSGLPQSVINQILNKYDLDFPLGLHVLNREKRR